MARDATAGKSGRSDSEGTGSTLAQIREKELEVDGQVMMARSEAEGRVNDAKTRASDAKGAAEKNAEEAVAAYENEAIAEAEKEAGAEKSAGEQEVLELRKQGESRRKRAVEEILKVVLGS